ncbi:MAG: hypothetical protein COA79_24135 [Planctomycetota bacterium]|nr:MAG: hypothetical protein COA79_24135 [Planctomycetota bacterium]
MDSNQVHQFYKSHNHLIDRLNSFDLEVSRELLYIVDTKSNKNLPIFYPNQRDITFDNKDELKTVLSGAFKKNLEPLQTDENIKNIFQIHFWIYDPESSLVFIIIAEKLEQKGLFAKITGKIDCEITMYVYSKENNTLVSSNENDPRFNRLIIQNLFKEAEDLFYSDNEYKKVESILVHCLEMAPNDVKVLTLIARCKLFLSEFESAEDIFKKTTEIAPNDAKTWLGLATAQMEIFKINPRKEHFIYVESSEQNVDQGLAVDPKNTELINLKGGINMVNQDYQKAEETFKLALEINPKDFNSQKNLGLSLMTQNKFEESKHCFLKGLEMRPKDETLAFRLIQSHFELDETEIAINLMEEWKVKAHQIDWLEELEMSYLTEVPEELLKENLEDNNQ